MVLRRRAVLRGAMVGGAAYYAGRRISQGEDREADQQARLEMLEAQQTARYAAPPPPPPSTPQKSVTEQLIELKQLLDAGVLTQAEFEAAKAKVLQA
jgi:Short C-terminal domain